MLANKLFKIVTLSGALMLSSAVTFAADAFVTDQGHTEIRVIWDHAGFSLQTAEFEKATGKLKLDQENIDNSKLDVEIDVASVSSGFEKLDEHLRSADFFGVEKNPTATFKSTSIKKTGEKTADITGDFTLNGVTQPLTLSATVKHIGDHPLGSRIDYYKGKWLSITAKTVIEDPQAYNVGPYPVGPITIEITSEMKEDK